MNSSVLHHPILRPQSTRVVVFDLDDTLLDTSGLLIPFAGTDKYFQMIKNPLPSLPGAIENLESLRKDGYRLFLVTQGKESIQKQKVASMQIASFFEHMLIVPVTDREVPERGLKYEAFLQLIRNFNLTPSEMLSVGNRPQSDLRPLKSLGGKTCWYRYGEHSHETSEHPWDQPDFVVHHHPQLRPICNLTS